MSLFLSNYKSRHKYTATIPGAAAMEQPANGGEQADFAKIFWVQSS